MGEEDKLSEPPSYPCDHCEYIGHQNQCVKGWKCEHFIARVKSGEQ